MKHNLLSPLIAAASSLFVAQSAIASDGTITFSGEITAQTCTINGGTADMNVVLPEVSVAALPTGSTAGDTLFSIQLTDCDLATGNVHTYFEYGPTVDIATGRLNNVSGSATGVQILLKNEDGSNIQAGFPEATQNSQTFQITGNAATLNYSAAYYASGTVATGSVGSSVTYSIVYE